MNHRQLSGLAAGAAVEGEPLAFASNDDIVARERDEALRCPERLCIAQYRLTKTFVNESGDVSCVLGQETLSSRKWAHGGAVA